MRTPLIVLLAVTLMGLIFVQSAHARARTFVASYGNDNNPCTFGSPCKTFQHAVDVVDDSGEVTAIDSAGFGPINITKGVTITSPNGVEAGVVTVVGGNAVTINATQFDAVVLRGLTIAGANSAGIGVYTQGEFGKLEIVDCVIRDFSNDGVFIQFPSTQSLVHISNTKIMNNANVGISIGGGSLTPRGRFDLDNVTVIDNNNYGVQLESFLIGTIENSDIANNGVYTSGGCNIDLSGPPSGPVGTALTLLLKNSTLGDLSAPCSIKQEQNSDVYISQVSGSFVLQSSPTDNSIRGDGTNIIQGGPSVTIGQIITH